MKFREKISLLWSLVGEDESTEEFDIKEILENKEIRSIYKELLGEKSGKDKFQSIQSRLQEKTVGGVTYFTMPESRDKNLIINLFREGKGNKNFDKISEEIKRIKRIGKYEEKY